jgi:Protein of unknown function (DUF2752)
MRWRPLRAGELDHELLWLCVSLLFGLLGLSWLHFALPTPQCLLHSLSGWPCPGCGSTRSVRLLLAHQWTAAFLKNPLATLSFLGVLGFDLYAGATLLFRTRRLRFDSVPARTAHCLRASICLLIGGNWLWLVKSGV